MVGKIEVETKESEGTEFTIRLPIVEQRYWHIRYSNSFSHNLTNPIIMLLTIKHMVEREK